MRGNLLGRMREEIAARQTFEKRGQLFARGDRGEQGEDAVDELQISSISPKALFVQAAGQVVCCKNIKLPQRLRLPGSERLGIHRTNIRIREETKQLQPFRRAYLLGKSANRSEIEDIAPQQAGGHGQMVTNEKAYGISLAGLQIKAAENFFDGFQAASDVVFAGHSLAHIVKEQRKEKKFGFLQLGKKSGERTFPVLLRFPQAVNIFDGHERMRVHRVMMVIIADHQGIDGTKLGEQTHE